MSRIPRAVGPGGEQQVSSRDTIEISTGRIYTRYYLTKVTNADGTAEPTMTTTSGTTHMWQSSAATSESSIEVDFDLEMIRPRRIGGLMYVNIGWETTTNDVDGYISVTVIRVDSTDTEHVLVATIDGYNETGNADQHKELFECDVPVTKFRAGDKLRITVKATCDSVLQYVRFWYDAGGGTSANGVDKLATVDVPFIPDF